MPRTDTGNKYVVRFKQKRFGRVVSAQLIEHNPVIVSGICCQRATVAEHTASHLLRFAKVPLDFFESPQCEERPPSPRGHSKSPDARRLLVAALGLGQ